MPDRLKRTGGEGFEHSGAAPDRVAQPPITFNLFWRTFFLIAALLFGSLVAWVQTLHMLEFEPHATQIAQEIASIVNISRAALTHTSGEERAALIRMVAEEEGVDILPREASDVVAPLARTSPDRRTQQILRQILGADTVYSNLVNGQTSVWVSFSVGSESFWLRLDHAHIEPANSGTWMVWLAIAGLLSLTGAALITRLINRPLADLSQAAVYLEEGNYQAALLNENIRTEEIRDVNIGFNRMARQLAQSAHDRALMLAGISHDLRTPLARLRLETEMSVNDPQARHFMSNDIEQLDAIIGKFLDYARPDSVCLVPVAIATVAEHVIESLSHFDDLQIRAAIAPDVIAMADAVELGRVLSNLVENARKYGKLPGNAVAQVDISARQLQTTIYLRVRDYGPGVSEELLDKLTQPFFRGDTARTEATGAGLGLSIVDKTVGHMGGRMSLGNAADGGFEVQISLQAAKPIKNAKNPYRA